MESRFAGTLATLIVGIAIATTMATGMIGAATCGSRRRAAAAASALRRDRAGRKAQLAAEFTKNVDPKARCFEVRMYTVDKARVGTGTFNGAINELHQRFREKEVAIFREARRGDHRRLAAPRQSGHAGLDAGLSRSCAPRGRVGEVRRRSRLEGAVKQVPACRSARTCS